jgi:predicted transcriptional regulator
VPDGTPPETGGSADGADGGTEAVEVVTNADRVERLLDEHGGRMRQADIVEALEWSKSKVSRVVSSMAEEGRVRKIRLGRENLIVLPGREPEGATSPY